MDCQRHCSGLQNRNWDGGRDRNDHSLTMAALIGCQITWFHYPIITLCVLLQQTHVDWDQSVTHYINAGSFSINWSLPRGLCNQRYRDNCTRQVSFIYLSDNCVACWSVMMIDWDSKRHILCDKLRGYPLTPSSRPRVKLETYFFWITSDVCLHFILTASSSTLDSSCVCSARNSLRDWFIICYCRNTWFLPLVVTSLYINWVATQMLNCTVRRSLPVARCTWRTKWYLPMVGVMKTTTWRNRNFDSESCLSILMWMGIKAAWTVLLRENFPAGFLRRKRALLRNLLSSSRSFSTEWRIKPW